ncbi:hypothetical protein K7X08_001364 [Anisodus acutangulus]|uniref:WHEP-TRS domain-containing protein n=1 Tax=Anisodus acutangulus TaxID=402998 RepID=A0A9Q1RMY8_9SOLA|nr:hypothetical protein K7X08_001364 [Anisodus acutangulus]
MSAGAGADEDSLRRALAQKQSSIDVQGGAVRQLKSSGATKPDIDAAIKALNALKLEKTSIESQLQAALAGGGSSSGNRDAFRQAVVNTLERRFFFSPSFKIYRGVAGLYDYGPPGCSVKSNVLAFWRQEKSSVALVASEKFSEPREVEKLVITPIKKELGLALKGNQKMVTEALEDGWLALLFSLLFLSLLNFYTSCRLLPFSKPDFWPEKLYLHGRRPLSLRSQIPNFHKLSWLSILAAVMSFAYSSIGLGLSIAKVAGVGHHVKTSLTGVAVGVDVSQSEKVWKSFQAIGDTAFAYAYSNILIEIQDLRSSPPESKVMKRASLEGVSTTTLFYILCGTTGYAAFGNKAPGNSLAGIGFYEPFWLIDLANICIAIHLIGGSMQQAMARQQIHQL